MYFIGFTILGGILAMFAIAGWNSYNEGKLPETQTLFRWFLAGITAAGISSYVWLFGTGGDPLKLMEKVSQALEVKEMMDTLKTPIGGAVAAVSDATASAASSASAASTAVAAVASAISTASPPEKKSELSIGMPTF